MPVCSRGTSKSETQSAFCEQQGEQMPLVVTIFSYRFHFVLDKHREFGSRYFSIDIFALDHEGKDGSCPALSVHQRILIMISNSI